MKQLTRDQMKNVKGGDEGLVLLGGGYMCCWTGTTNCSVCVPAGYPSCVKDATATPC